MDLDGATQFLGGLNLLCSARSFMESVADLSSSALNVPISATSVIVVTGQQAAGTCGLEELTEGCCWRVAVPCEEAEQLAAGSESSDERDWGWAWSSPDSGADETAVSTPGGGAIFASLVLGLLANVSIKFSCFRERLLILNLVLNNNYVI